MVITYLKLNCNLNEATDESVSIRRAHTQENVSKQSKMYLGIRNIYSINSHLEKTLKQI